jgi:hypothetical protein
MRVGVIFVGIVGLASVVRCFLLVYTLMGLKNELT